MRLKKLLRILACMCCICAFLMPLKVFASGGEEKETLTVDAVWLQGEMLKIDVTNLETGNKQNLELRLKDYTDDSEYVSIQAVDLDGNKSNIVQIKNPYYKTPVKPEESPVVEVPTIKKTESAIPTGNSSTAVPFTPNGDGTVMDNATEKNGKEFFTIKTPNDNVFHLIIDRQRTGENVYLLNAVTEEDLLALSQKGNGKTMSAIPTATTKPIEPQPQEETNKTNTDKQEQKPNTATNGSSSYLIIGIAVLVVGAVGYYFKIYRPRTQANEVDEEASEEISEEGSAFDFYGDEYAGVPIDDDDKDGESAEDTEETKDSEDEDKV